MNTNKIYQVVYNYLNGEVNNLDELLEGWERAEADPTKVIGGIPALIALCAALRNEMRAEANKSNGKANIAKAMKAIIKNVPDYRQQLKGAFVQNGKQYACDGYRAIRLNNSIDLPAPPVEPTMDFEQLFADTKRNATTPLETPALGELKAYVKIKKAENKAKYGKRANRETILWNFGEEQPTVNAVYLLDILTAFPNSTITYSTLTAPLYFSHDDGEAILLPMRIK